MHDFGIFEPVVDNDLLAAADDCDGRLVLTAHGPRHPRCLGVEFSKPDLLDEGMVPLEARGAAFVRS